jgi:hypothetical protein
MLSSENGENESEDTSNEGKDNLVDAMTVNVERGHQIGCIGDAEEAARPASQDSVDQEEQEEFVVSKAYCIAYPRAKVVHLQNAGTSHRT